MSAQRRSARGRALAGLGVLSFVGFALVQSNDPDPMLWSSVYGVAAFFCLLAMWHRLPAPLGLAAASIALAFAARMWPDRERIHFDDEVVREVGGLVVVGAWLAALSLPMLLRRHREVTGSNSASEGEGPVPEFP